MWTFISEKLRARFSLFSISVENVNYSEMPLSNQKYIAKITFMLSTSSQRGSIYNTYVWQNFGRIK